MPLVLKVCGGTWERDSRDKRELSVYRECGADVAVLAKGNSTDRGRQEEVDGFVVYRYSTRPLGNRVPNPINRAISLFTWARFIKSIDNGLVRIAASENRSSYIVLDNTPIVLYKNTNIGTKEVISYGNADDQYREALSETTDLIINDNGGNDSLEISGGYYDIIGDAHMRYFFDVTDEGVVSDAKHIIWTDNFYTPNKEEYEEMLEDIDKIGRASCRERV